MWHLMKSELYQLTHRKAPFIWLIMAFIFTLLFLLIPYLSMQFDGSVGFESLLSPTLALEAYTTLIKNIAIYFLLSISVTAYNNAIKNRTLNNEISYGHSRTAIYLSKVFSAFILAIAFFIVSALTFATICLVYFHNSWDFYFQGIVIDLLIPYLPLWITYLCLYTTTFILTSNLSFIGIILFLIVASNLIFSLGSLLIKWLATIRPFIFTELNIDAPVLFNNMDITYQMIIFYIILFAGIGIFFFHRREMK